MMRVTTIVLLVVAAASNVSAALIGHPIEVSYRFPNMTTVLAGRGEPISAVVGSAVEFPDFMDNPQCSIDVSDTQIRIFNFRSYDGYPGPATFAPANFNGFAFRDAAGTIPDFAGVSANWATTIAGLTPDRLPYNADLFLVNLQGLRFDATSQIVLDLSFASPEPATLSLLALAGLPTLRRKPTRSAKRL